MQLQSSLVVHSMFFYSLGDISVMMASAQVVETSVNTNNSPSQDYTTNPDDHSNHNRDISCRSKELHFITGHSCFPAQYSSFQKSCIILNRILHVDMTVSEKLQGPLDIMFNVD